MSPFLLFIFILVYFLLLLIIGYLTSKNNNNNNFFSANKKSKWYMIAFGMIGTTMSGVTFISVPGKVSVTALSYFPFVMGNAVGLLAVAFVLLPLYYRLNLISIYGYIGLCFGMPIQKIAASLFLISRSIGSAARLYLVLIVLQHFVFEKWHVHFSFSAAFCLLAIWAYTIKGGLKTIIWTDTIQTFLLLLALFFSVYFIINSFSTNLLQITNTIQHQPYMQMFFWDNFLTNKQHFLKNFIGGVVVTLAMVGLDQDIMQKNLSLPNIKEAQKNFIVFIIVFIIVNFLFLIVGALLKMYADAHQLNNILKTDYIYPTIALEHLSLGAGIIFMLGLTAATFSTTDSALTALTTSFCIDILEMKLDEPETKKRFWVHTLFCIFIFTICCLLYFFNSDAIVDTIFTIAGYTYAPLLALFIAGFFQKIKLNFFSTIFACLVAPLCGYLFLNFLKVNQIYVAGFEAIIFNSFLCWIALMIVKNKQTILRSL